MSEYEIVFNVKDLDVWHLILYANEEEWRDIEIPLENCIIPNYHCHSFEAINTQKWLGNQWLPKA